MINLLTRVLPSIPRRVFGETWTGRDSNRRWAKAAMSGNGQYQIAYTDSLGAGANQLYVSNDYGSTWTAKESPRVWSDIKLSFDGQIQVALENAAGSGRIYVSVNFGNTWQARGPVNAWTYVALSLTGEKMTVVSSISGALYFSSDFGTTWTSPVNPPWDGLGVGAFKGIAMNAAGDKQTAAAGNHIYISSDFGATWTNPLYRWNVSQPVISSNAQIQMLYGAESNFQTFPQINVSVDFGATWVKKEYITTRNWHRLAISADGTRAAGIVGGYQIFVSSNTGNTWTSKLTVDPSKIYLFLLEMSSNGKNLIAGAYRQLYVSTDYGENWALKYLPAPLTGLKISSDGTHGTATLTPEKIYTTQRTRLI